MIRKPSRLALSGIALVCAGVFAACNCAPTLRSLILAPNNGTIYVSAQQGDAIRGARRAASAPAHSTRRSAATPQDITTAVCGTLQYAATGYYSNGTTKDQTSAVTWSSSDTTKATIGPNTGLAQGVALGFTNIGATLGGITATTTQLEVDLLNSITVAPLPPVTNPLPAGQTQQFAATGSFTLAGGGDTTLDISGQVIWTTDDSTVATIDQTGLLTAVGSGEATSTTVRATSCDNVIVGTATVTVTQPTTRLVITPSTLTAAAGTTVQFTAMENNNGTLQTPSSPVSWSSSATTVASINSSTGLAQALTPSGTAVTITASEPGNTSVGPGTASLTVQAAVARFAYVANISGGSGGTGSIFAYSVNVGSSTPITPNTNQTANPVPEPANPEQVLLHPSGDLLFFIDGTGALNSRCLDSTNGVIATATPPAVPAPGQNPQAVSDVSGDIYVGVIDPTGRFIYVVAQGSTRVYGFQITHNQTGCGMGDAALTSIFGAPGYYTDSSINTPTWIMTDQTGNYLYIVNNGTNTVSEYSISQAAGTLGQLTPLGNSPVNTNGISSYFGTTDVNGHVFVANEGNVGVADTSHTVTAFTITASGANAGQLTMIGSSPTPIAGTIDTFNVVTSPNGNNLYVLDYGDGTNPGQVIAYGLTPATGVIGSVVGTPQPTDVSPIGMAIDPTGALLAIDNFGANDISLYTVGSNGAPTPTSPTTVSAGTEPQFVVFYTAASGQ